MKTILFKAILLCGNAIGQFSKLFLPPNLFYLNMVFNEGICTGRHKSRFGSFGVGSRLSPKMLLVHPEFANIGKHCHFAPHVIIEINRITKDTPLLQVGDNC